MVHAVGGLYTYNNTHGINSSLKLTAINFAFFATNMAITSNATIKLDEMFRRNISAFLHWIYEACSLSSM
jgi:hypothetical protein